MRGRDLLVLLQRSFDAAARARFIDEAQALDEALQKAAALASATRERADRFARARLRGSFTLTRQSDEVVDLGLELEAWNRANALASRFAAEDARLEVARVRQIAASTVGSDGLAELRTRDVWFAGHPCPPADDLDELLAMMPDAVEGRARDVHPIAAAALAQQWIVSTHPFPNGNGRTARLVADWILARHGYPPATYAHPLDALNAIVDHCGVREPIGVEAAARVVLTGVKNSVALL